MIGSHGFEGISITGVVVLPDAEPQAVEAAYSALEVICEPCPAKIAAGKLAELKSLTVTRKRDDTDMEVAAGAYTSRLARYPVDVVVAACDAWADREQFWPSWAELKAECDKRFRGRGQVRAALQRALRQ